MDDVAALIIAAGKSGSPEAFDPAKQVGSISAAERLAVLFKTAGIGRVVLVEAAGQKMERQTGRLGVVCLQMETGETAEMLDAVKTGLCYLQGKCGRVLITPVDVPLFSVKTVRALAENEADVAIPSHKKKGGHPVALSAGVFGSIIAYNGPGGLAGALKSTGAQPVYLEVQDEGVLLDIEKQNDYELLLQNSSLNELRFEQKLSILREKPFFGPGPYFILRLVEETGSLRLACTQMGISYSKGWKIVESIEEQLGMQVVERKRGGAQRGHSTLTACGKKLMAAYAAFSAECDQAARAAFARNFKEFL